MKCKIKYNRVELDQKGNDDKQLFFVSHFLFILRRKKNYIFLKMLEKKKKRISLILRKI